MDEETQKSENTNPDNYHSESLESQTTVVQNADNSPPPTLPNNKKPEKIKRRWFKRIIDHFNIYLLLFVALILIAIAVIVFSLVQNRNSNNNSQLEVTTEPLSEEILDQLRQTDVKVGNPKQILSIESNAVFAGKVLVKDTLEVASSINAGGSINTPSLNVSGSSAMNQLQANQLQITGDASIQGSMNVQNNLTVSGSGTFNGGLTASSLNIQNLNIDGDLQFNRHITPSGGNPSKSDGNALGAGGTSSVSGTDTAGTVTINTGGNPASGCFITVNFTQGFNGTPHVVITPVGSGAAGLNYYINRSGDNFSICSTNPAPGSQNLMFDYIVVN